LCFRRYLIVCATTAAVIGKVWRELGFVTAPALENY
jgi:hypothetical protein